MRFVSICALVSMFVVEAGPVSAVTIVDSTVLLKVGDEAAKVFGKLEDRLLKGNRAASAQAKVPKTDIGRDFDSGTFFGGTRLVEAERKQDDPKAKATATAQNTLRGKKKTAVLDPPDGPGQARADLLWKGEVVLTTYKGDPLPPPKLPFAPVSATPGTPGNVEAFVLIDFIMDGFEIRGTGGVSGALDIFMAWDGVEGFSGGIGYASGVESGAPQFSGDLLGYETEFGSSPFSIVATDLMISGSSIVPIDYLDFYQTRSVTIAFDGQSSLAVSGVPLPPGVLLLLSSAALLLIPRRLKRSSA